MAGKSTDEWLKQFDAANEKLKVSSEETIKQQRDLIAQLMTILTALLAKQA